MVDAAHRIYCGAWRDLTTRARELNFADCMQMCNSEAREGATAAVHALTPQNKLLKFCIIIESRGE
jgi:hypothetical protein